ncbi:ABC transporter substrate-binding protein [Sinomonas cellulolyticus]|uniref:Extracellular solute-binding protein n=1 Tax=Sinomonas cellulolyticus TaxID=2801916 RepID=A0ABS1JXD4_9MICC|nr:MULTISPECIES: extracellular solute-binding protein [Sinomonas]MBL0703994.1 extracellular solute-binding protein [Sinomonas cellulolyticus]GHG59084.1 ABC transporter substrate-binding protein [Sinomonas sp. KCTC 49339]
MAVTVRGMAWDHPRGVGALRAISEAFNASHPDIRVEWDARPLASFEDTPVAQLAQEYDLMAIDHPFIGDCAASGAVVPISALLSVDQLADRADDAVGASHQSYLWQGQQWGLGLDAAAHVAAYDALELASAEVPRCWADFADLSQRLGTSRIAVPANPTHMWGTLLSLCELVSGPQGDGGGPLTAVRHADGRPSWWSAGGIDPEVLAEALERLRELLSLCAPESLEMSPIDVLEAMSDPAKEDTRPGYAYSPYVFGYITYSRPADGRRQIRFLPSPSLDGNPIGTLTGGVGLAISSRSTSRAEAACFAAYATSRDVQVNGFPLAGGQPGRRSAWQDETFNAHAGGFGIDTLPSVGRGFLRARFAGFPAFQKSFAHVLHAAIVAHAPTASIVQSFRDGWDRHVLQPS